MKRYLQKLLRGLLGQKTQAGMTPEDFEARLPTNVIIIEWTTALTNPGCFIVKSPSPEKFLAYMNKHATYFEAVYLLKKSIGSGRYNYVNPNWWLGVSVDV